MPCLLNYKLDASMPNDIPEEFDKDMSAPIKDLSNALPWLEHDAKFTYCLDDINKLSDELGIPWA